MLSTSSFRTVLRCLTALSGLLLTGHVFAGPFINNDFFDERQVIPATSLPVQVTGNDLGASLEADEIAALSLLEYDSGRSLWYSFTPLADATYFLSGDAGIRLLDGEFIRNITSVFRVAGDGSLTELDGVVTYTAGDLYAEFIGLAGSEYVIRIASDYGDINTAPFGNFSFELDQQDPPAEDLFANRYLISQIPSLFSTVSTTAGAGTEPGETHSTDDRSVWYDFVTYFDTELEISAIAFGDLPSVFGAQVFTADGSGIENLVPVTDFVELDQALRFNATANTVYTVRFASSDQVNFNFKIDPVGDFDGFILGNYSSASTIDFGAEPLRLIGQNASEFSSTETDEPSVGTFGENTVWARVKNTLGQRVITIDTIGSNFDTVLQVFTANGGGLGDLVLQDQNDDLANNTLQSRLNFRIEAGEEIAIRVMGFRSDRAGGIVLNLNPGPPDNDDWASNEFYPSLPDGFTFDLSGTTAYATIEADEPAFLSEAESTVWYAFDVFEEGFIYLQNTSASSTAHTYHLARGGRLASLTELGALANNTDTLKVYVGDNEAETIYLAVVGNREGTDDYNFSINFEAVDTELAVATLKQSLVAEYNFSPVFGMNVDLTWESFSFGYEIQFGSNLGSWTTIDTILPNTGYNPAESYSFSLPGEGPHYIRIRFLTGPF